MGPSPSQDHMRRVGAQLAAMWDQLEESAGYATTTTTTTTMPVPAAAATATAQGWAGREGEVVVVHAARAVIENPEFCRSLASKVMLEPGWVRESGECVPRLWPLVKNGFVQASPASRQLLWDAAELVGGGAVQGGLGSATSAMCAHDQDGVESAALLVRPNHSSASCRGTEVASLASA